MNKLNQTDPAISDDEPQKRAFKQLSEPIRLSPKNRKRA
jgi:hypothetical protein